MSANWSELQGVLSHLAGAGQQAKFWLRDDDAISDTPALHQLGDWADQNGTEILLALVPSAADETLQQLIDTTPQFIGAVHGWAHKNHAQAPEKKQELGAHRPLDMVGSELAAALERTKALCGPRALPVLVPPWNRVSPDVVQLLPELGFCGLSTFSDAFTLPARAGLVVQNSHVDIIDWRGTRGGRVHGDLVEEVIAAIALRAPEDQPIGILSHHLVHDEAAWSFLDKLGQIVQMHPGAAWTSPAAVFSAQTDMDSGV